MFEALLLALGLPAALVTAIVGLPIYYVFSLVVILLLIKFAIYPVLSKAVDKLITQFLSKGDILITKLDEISSKLDKSNQRVAKLEQLINEISSDSIGNTDIELALSTFGNILDKAHLRATMFFNHRCTVNHYLGNEQIIQNRYNNKAIELSGKIFAQLSKYSYSGVALSTFYKNNGIESYIKHLLSELCDLQGLKAMGDATEVNAEDIQAGLDRLLQKQMQLFREWMYSLNDDKIYVNVKRNVSIKIISDIEDIE